MTKFIFDSFDFDTHTNTATFHYSFDTARAFTESVTFEVSDKGYDEAVLERALRLAFLLIGSSYIKTFPTRDTVLPFAIDGWTANFLNSVYQEGMGQFAFENNLNRKDLPHFKATSEPENGAATGLLTAVDYQAEGILSLQSGGKDSLLTAQLLKRAGYTFTPWYVSSGAQHPDVLNSFDEPLCVSVRTIDREALRKATLDGGMNGHVPITYIVQSLAIIQAILLGKRDVISSIAHEGEEPHAYAGDIPVSHQWSKTWRAEQLFAEYVERYISPVISVGSPLRRFSELHVAELFAQQAWKKYGNSFSSCNRANYLQGADNHRLQWCGECPKCANSYLLFAPYVDANELQALFNGVDLFSSTYLRDTFKGLLGVDGFMKPFECVGEIEELRYAYHAAMQKPHFAQLPFTVPKSNFNPLQEYNMQANLRRYSDVLGSEAV